MGLVRQAGIRRVDRKFDVLGATKRVVKRLPMFDYCIGTLIQRGKPNSTFFNHRENLADAPELECTKILSERTLYADRLQEVQSFYGVSRVRLLAHYLRNGTPNTNYYRQRLEDIFDSHGTDADRLKLSYERASFMYVNRLMLRYHHYRLGLQAQAIVKELTDRKPSELRVLDYGCGVADPSLFLALQGAQVTLVDLADPKFDFTRSRFRARGLHHVAIAAEQTEEPVPIEGVFDVVLMAEFLEHVRSPRRFLEYALDHLAQDGVFYDSLGPVFRHNVGGQHLREAKAELSETDYEDFFGRNLQAVNDLLGKMDYPHFYVRAGR